MKHAINFIFSLTLAACAQANAAVPKHSNDAKIYVSGKQSWIVDRGVIWSTSAKGEWREFRLPSESHDAQFVPLSPDSLWVLVNEKLYSSTDHGKSWKAFSLPRMYSVSGIGSTPSNQLLVYGGVVGNRVPQQRHGVEPKYISEQLRNGEEYYIYPSYAVQEDGTWQVHTSPLPEGPITALAFQEKAILATTPWEVFRLDYPKPKKYSHTDDTEGNMSAIAVGERETFWVGKNSGVIERCSEKTCIPLTNTTHGIEKLGVYAGRIFAKAGPKLLSSTDGGKTWESTVQNTQDVFFGRDSISVLTPSEILEIPVAGIPM